MSDVFISYSHDNNNHEQKVIDLAKKLRELGVDVELDKYTPRPEMGWPLYMISNVMNSKYTLCICSKSYKDRFEQREPIGTGKGAKFEGKLISEIIYDSEVNKKFIPILLDNGYSETDIPLVLKSYTYYNLSNSEEFIKLYATLTNQEQQIKPHLGQKVSIQELQKTLNIKDSLEETSNKVKKQCIARFRSNGLDEKTANDILSNLLLSDKFNYLLPENRKTNYVVGDFGAGKSLALAVLYLQKIASKESALLISARDITDGVSLDKYLNVDSIKEKTTIFIDGLDEISYSSGKKIIDGIILSETYCDDLRFVVSSRPNTLIENYCKNELVNILPLSFDESIDLMSRAAGDTVSVGIVLGWSDELKDSLLNPFFAILSGLYFKETNQLGLSKQAFIKYLIQKSINPLGMDEVILNQLEKIAVKYIMQEQNKILISDLSSSINIHEILATGLIQLENDYIYFSLPIVAQWLAAAAIKDNIIDKTNIFHSQTEIIKWRYALMLFIGNSSFEDSKEYFKIIVSKYPGLASQILKDNITLEDIESLPSADICANQISFCIHMWAEGFQNLAKTIIPYDNDKICTIKLSVHGSGLNIWWMMYYSGQDYEVITSPPNENEYCYHTFTRVGKTSLWPWVITFNILSGRLKQFIKNKPLFLDCKDLKEEFYYDVARKVLHQGSLCREDISLDKLKESLQNTIKVFQIDLLKSEICKLEKSGYSYLKYPHIQPDLPLKSGWIWNMYSHNQLIDYIHSIYNKAVNVYKDLCDKYFTGLANMMPMRLMLPATMHITLVYGIGQYLEPTIQWYFVCKDQNQDSEIIVTESSGMIESNDIYGAILSSIVSYRQNIVSLCPVSMHVQILDIFNEKPLHKIIFNWLEEDLKSIGWLD